MMCILCILDDNSIQSSFKERDMEAHCLPRYVYKIVYIQRAILFELINPLGI